MGSTLDVCDNVLTSHYPQMTVDSALAMQYTILLHEIRNSTAFPTLSVPVIIFAASFVDRSQHCHAYESYVHSNQNGGELDENGEHRAMPAS